MQTSYVYTHYRLGTNVPFYVGIGKVRSKGISRHLQQFSRNRYWKFIVAKDNGFDSVKIAENIDRELAALAEIEKIDQLRRLGFKLANLTDGGEGTLGSKHNLGLIRSDSTKEKIRQANLGKKQSQETINKRIETFKKVGYKPKNNFGFGEKNNNYKGQYITPNGIFNTLEECAKGNNCTAKKVRMNLYGNITKVNGKIYKYYPKHGWDVILKG